jgi:hypothetical protein
MAILGEDDSWEASAAVESLAEYRGAVLAKSGKQLIRRKENKNDNI